MTKIRYTISIGYAGCDEEDVIDIADDMTHDQIDAMVDEMAQEYAQSWEGDQRLCWDDDMTEEEYGDATHAFYENIAWSWEYEPD